MGKRKVDDGVDDGFVSLPRISEEAYEWLNDEILQSLSRIVGPETRKKRTTVILLAHAIARGIPMKEVFKLSSVCAQATWYRKWRRDPVIFAAFEMCVARALTWVDEEVAALEAHWTRVRRMHLAEQAANAPLALGNVALNQNQKGSDRIEAAKTLLRFVDPEIGNLPLGGGPTTHEVNLEAKVDREILRLLEEAGVPQDDSVGGPSDGDDGDVGGEQSGDGGGDDGVVGD